MKTQEVLSIFVVSKLYALDLRVRMYTSTMKLYSKHKCIVQTGIIDYTEW